MVTLEELAKIHAKAEPGSIFKVEAEQNRWQVFQYRDGKSRRHLGDITLGCGQWYWTQTIPYLDYAQMTGILFRFNQIRGEGCE